MELTEYPLLHTQDLMLAVLRSAADGPGTLADGLARIRATLDLAGEAPPVADEDILAHLDRARFQLLKAGLVEAAGGDRYQTTERGLAVLEEHPTGVDESVLMAFPEYRAHVERSPRAETGVPGRAETARRTPEYDEGYAAFREGRSLADNPYPWDQDRHLAWENGWSESRDAELRSADWRDAKSR
ncbi:ribosome modulation factor [Arenibaculum sp.]|jgi:restriction endonuclease Mrr|uniref:ribosome modulation factor n=1 Tax=Arenibaculum sp. TaxID=2865862 RepID=UPI002E114752|nr:hypothetical protein [Arenibaculum sp.]